MSGLSIDPVAADVNLYRYVGNNPVIYVDPSGLSTLDEAIERLEKAGQKVTQQSVFDEWYRYEKTLGAWWKELPNSPLKLSWNKN